MGRRGLPGQAGAGPVQGPPSVPSARSPSGWQHGLFLPNKAWAAVPGQAQAPAERRAAAGLPGHLFLLEHGASWPRRALSPRSREPHLKKPRGTVQHPRERSLR